MRILRIFSITVILKWLFVVVLVPRKIEVDYKLISGEPVSLIFRS